MTQILIFPLLLLLTSFAFSPMSQTIELGDGVKQVQYLVDNPTSEAMAVEISIKERIQKEDGTEEMPKTSELAAFPPQLIIPPKEKRSIRVSWMGTKPPIEKSFRVVAEQLPLEVDGKKRKGSGIKMLLRYVAALYVNPGDTAPKLSFKVLEIAPKLKVMVENSGSMHAALTKPKVTLTKEKNKIVLSGDQLKGLAGENVLAGNKRIFLLEQVKGVTLEHEGSLIVE